MRLHIIFYFDKYGMKTIKILSEIEGFSFRNLPKNLPPKSHYITNKPLKQQQPAFASDEFDDYREKQEDKNIGKGVVLRYKLVKHHTTKVPILYAYWSHDFAPDFNDCKAFGEIDVVGDLYSEANIELIQKLIVKEGSVHVYLTNDITNTKEHNLPADVKSFIKWLTKHQYDKKYDGALNFEIEQSVSSEKAQLDIVNIPKAELRLPKSAQQNLENIIFSHIKRNSFLLSKFMSASAYNRAKAMKVGIEDLYKFNDVLSALDIIEEILV